MAITGLRFAFYGRTSTAEFQEPVTSRAWQREIAESVIPGNGVITSEFFDVGCSRRVPWARRPRAAVLLDQVQEADCGFDAVVVGEFEPSPRRNANQPAPSSPEATSRLRISLCPSAFTTVAIRACTLTNGFPRELHRQRLDPHERVGARIQRAGAERGDLSVQVTGHLADLGARQALDPELLGQPLDGRVETPSR